MSIRTTGILLLLAAFSAGTLEAEGAERIKGSGKLAKATRKLPAFHALSLNLPADMSIAVGTDEGVLLEADDNILPHITTEVKDGQLTIDSPNELQTNSKITVKLKTAKLDQLTLKGASISNVSGLSGNSFSLSSKGASTISLAGTVNKANLAMNGAGQIQASKLNTKETSISINGTGSAELNVSEKLDATIKGTASVRYHGNAKVTQKIMGVGAVTKI